MKIQLFIYVVIVIVMIVIITRYNTYKKTNTNIKNIFNEIKNYNKR